MADDAAILSRDGSISQSGVDLHAARRGLPTDRFLAIPVSREGQSIGHSLISSATAIVRPTPDQLKVAVLLAVQVGHRTPAS